MEKSALYYLTRFTASAAATFIVVALVFAGLQIYVPDFYETLGPASLVAALAALVIVPALPPARAFATHERRQASLIEGFVLSHLFSASFLFVFVAIAWVTDYISNGTVVRDATSDPVAALVAMLVSFVVCSILFWALLWVGITGELRRSRVG